MTVNWYNWYNWYSSSFRCFTLREGQLESLLALLSHLLSVPLLCLLSIGRVYCLVVLRVTKLHALPALTYKWSLHLFTMVSKYKQENSFGSQNAAAWASKNYHWTKLLFKRYNQKVFRMGAGAREMSNVLPHCNSIMMNCLCFSKTRLVRLCSPLLSAVGLRRRITILIHCVIQFGQLNELTLCPLNGIGF